MSSKRWTCLAMAALLAMSTSTSARVVYQWTDRDGVEHFSDTPVPGARRIWVPDSVVADAAAESRPDHDPSAAADPETCALRKTQLEQYERSVSIAERNHLGEEREYTLAEREELLALTREQLEQACAS